MILCEEKKERDSTGGYVHNASRFQALLIGSRILQTNSSVYSSEYFSFLCACFILIELYFIFVVSPLKKAHMTWLLKKNGALLSTDLHTKNDF